MLGRAENGKVKLGVAKANEVDESIALIAARVKAIHKLAYAAFVVATVTDKKGLLYLMKKLFRHL